MSDYIDNGGTAFPGPNFTQSGNPNGHSMGMTLRDWFAGQALSGVVVQCAGDARALGQTTEQMLAERAYELADAMIAARKGGDA